MADKKLDPIIADTLKAHGFGPEACWNSHGTWVVYHRVLEQIAAKAEIAFDLPTVLEANGVAKTAAICVSGRRGEKVEWSIGEAAPGNNKTAYPFAMAEKRAKDRVILKLIGLHGLAYSEEEADDFKAQTAPANDLDAEERQAAVLIRRIEDTTSERELDLLVRSDGFITPYRALSPDVQEKVIASGTAKRDGFLKKEKAA